MTRGQWRAIIRERGACERCGRTERLHAHHIDRDPTNNVIENGELLCVWCHDEEHKQGGSIIAFDEACRNPSPETRRKRSEAMQGRSPVNRGIPLSENQKRKISESRRGQQLTDEHKTKLKEAALRQYEDPAQRQLVGDRARGRADSDETRRRKSEGQRRRWQAVRESSETGPGVERVVSSSHGSTT